MTEPLYIPEPGEFFVERTSGWAGRLIRVGTDSDVNHAGIFLGQGQTLEAQPGGAIFGNMSPARMDLVLWSGMNPALRLSRIEGQTICEKAREHHGDRYSWVDVAAIGYSKLTHGHVPSWLRQRLADPHMNMCSQLVDRCYEEAGFHLFRDGRLNGDVSPGDLRTLISQRVGV